MTQRENPIFARLFAAHDIRRGFSDAVHAEVEAFQQHTGIEDPNLLDLTQLPFVTIDNEDSRDLDQALYITQRGDGFVVYYALADGDYYVRPNSALFKEALARGSSYYLPGLCEPMLPRALSEDLVSLNPNVKRRAFVFEMRLDSAGQRLDTQLYRGRIRSRAKLSYAGVQDLLDNPDTGPLVNQEFSASLFALRTVGLLRMAEARRRSVVQFHRSEIWLAETKNGFKVTAGTRYEVERYNEQISLLCNMEGAAFLVTEHPHIQGIYRVHPAPEPERLQQVAERISHIVESHKLPIEAWTWSATGDEPLGDYLARLPMDGPMCRVSLAIARQVRYTFQRSDFRPEVGPHFGVGAPAYCRFSSPMREIAGIFTHNEALEKLNNSFEPDGADEALREAVIEAANRSKVTQSSLEKAVHKIALDTLFEPELALAEDQRTRFKGTVMGLRRSRLYVEFDNPPVEVKVYAQDLSDSDEVFTTASEDTRLCSDQRTFTLGGGILVWVTGYDKDRRRWQLKASPEN